MQANAGRCLRRAGIVSLHTVALGFLLIKTIEQAIAGKPVPGALGKPGDRALIFVGHDTNIANMAGMLGLSWLIPGYQRDDTPPGGALVFELWRASATGDHTVRTYYMAQTLEQMRKALPVTLNAPPAGRLFSRRPAAPPAKGGPAPGKHFTALWKPQSIRHSSGRETGAPEGIPSGSQARATTRAAPTASPRPAAQGAGGGRRTSRPVRPSRSPGRCSGRA
jgi:hypothetical protein